MSNQTNKANADVLQNIVSNINGNGASFELSFKKGPSFNHPTFVVWLEDTTGNFIQTLFVTKSYGSGVFAHGNKSGGKWKPGQVSRPAALPYWSHKAGHEKGIAQYVPDSTSSVPDAYTGATPAGSFALQTKGDKNYSDKLRIFFEINQTWDWNPYWTNTKYPDDAEYNTSCQPAVVYAATIDMNNTGKPVQLTAIGRSSHNGSDGELYTDLNTLTTALEIAQSITVFIK
jgi:hypothetical protein